MKKRTIVFLLALTLALTALSVPVGLAEAGERPVITIGRAANVNIEDYETTAFTLMLEEALCVDIRVEIYSEAASKLSILVGANAELPDIINFGLDGTTVFNYGSRGVFLPLNDYFADPELAPNFLALDAAVQAQILNLSRASDGNNYSMPILGVYFPNEVNYNFFVNTAWLEQLGLSMPTTTEEFKDMLAAFVANDMNGNGQKDEIGLMSYAGGWGADAVAYLLNSFVPANPDKNYFYAENGEIKAAFLMDEFRDGLRYVHSLIAEGLMDPATFTQNQDQFKAIMNQDAAVAGAFAATNVAQAYNKPTDAQANYDILYDHPIASQYYYMAPLVGPAGQHNTIYNPTLSTELFFITSYCENPELAFQLGDLGYDAYNSLISRHGREDEHWTSDPEVLAQYKAATIDGVQYEPTWVVISDPWGMPQNVHWNQGYPGYFPFAFNLTRGQNMNARTSALEIVYNMKHDALPEEYIGRLTYSLEENEELALIKTVIDEYVKECVTAFVTGNMDIENDWDRYLSELNNMDVTRYVELVQAGYDRSK